MQFYEDLFVAHVRTQCVWHIQYISIAFRFEIVCCFEICCHVGISRIYSAFSLAFLFCVIFFSLVFKQIVDHIKYQSIRFKYAILWYVPRPSTFTHNPIFIQQLLLHMLSRFVHFSFCCWLCLACTKITTFSCELTTKIHPTRIETNKIQNIFGTNSR